MTPAPLDPDRLRDIDPGPDELPVDPLHQQQPQTRVPWLAIALLIAAAGAAVWWFAPRSGQSPAESVGRTATEPVAEAPVRPSTDLGVGAADPNLPPLDAMDAYVRPLLAALSSRPELAALLASDELVRRFAASVDAVARGDSPARQVRAVAPQGPFVVATTREGLVADPSSYARYDGLVALVADLEPQALARLYGRLGPRLDDAYAELGSGGTFADAMRRALVHLVSTPDVEGTPRLQAARGTNYAYVDSRLEGLSAAQRQLLRLGPEGAERVKARLREFGIALGIPASEFASPAGAASN